MKKGLKFILAGAAGALPFVAFAVAITDFNSLIAALTSIVVVLIPFIIGLAVLVILWGIFGYITGAGDEEKRGEAKQYIIWGIIGLFVMTAIWGLVSILENTFTTTKTIPTSPGIPSALGAPCIKTPAVTVGGVTTPAVTGVYNAAGVCS